jgi:hypothetical protein
VNIKALTVKQPWAWAIADGHKPVENRKWKTRHRGLLAIHAGRAWDLPGARWMRAQPAGPVPPGMDEVTRGAVVAVVELVGVCGRSEGSRYVRCDCGPWAVSGQFHWQLKDPSPLSEPFLVSGQLGLWDIDLPDSLIGASA